MPENSFSRQQSNGRYDQRYLQKNFPQVETVGASSFDAHFLLKLLSFSLDFLLLSLVTFCFAGVLLTQFGRSLSIWRRDDGHQVGRDLVIVPTDVLGLVVRPLV